MKRRASLAAEKFFSKWRAIFSEKKSLGSPAARNAGTNNERSGYFVDESGRLLIGDLFTPPVKK